MKTLTAATLSFPAQRTPEDGDAGSGPTFETCYQDTADRTGNLNARLTVIEGGASKLLTVADAAAVRAITSHANGDVVALAGGNNGGVYVYDAASSRADDGVLCIKPTDVGVGTGRFLHPAVKLLSASALFTALACAGNASIGGDVNCVGTLNAGADANVSGETTTGTLVCTGASTLTGAVTCSAGLTVAGDVSVAGETETGTLVCLGAASVNGPAQFSDSVTLTGEGRIRRRLHVVSANTDLALAIATGAGVDHVADVFYVPTGVLSASRTYVLKNTGAGNGSEMEIATDDATYGLVLYQNDGATPVGGGALKNASGYIRAMRLIYGASGWRLITSDRVP